MTAKLFFSATAALTLATSLASAVMLDSTRSSSARPSPDDQPCTVEQQNLPSTDLAPPAGPRVGNVGTLDLGLTFIYWKTQYSFGNYTIGGFLGTTPSLAFGDKIPKGKVTTLAWSYKPGFKAKLGWIFPNNNWELFTEYTWRYQNPTKNSVKSGKSNPNIHAVPDVISPTPSGLVYGGISPDPTKATSEWSQHFNVLDLMLTTNFYLNRFLNVQPMIGFKLYDIRTKVGYSFYGITETGTDAFLDGSSAAIALTEKALGIGPRLGLKSLWDFNRNWGIFGSAFFSLPWGYFKETRVNTFHEISTGVSGETSNVGKKEHQWQSVMEYQLGLSYQAWFHQEKYQFTLQAAWELQMWGAQRFIPNVGFTLGMGTMSTQGFTLSAGFAF